MLLNGDTAVKVAHDIIHDANEFFTKWPLLIADSTTVPDGHVDFEFSDGSLIRVPCAWMTLLFAEGATRPAIVFKRGNMAATWKPGSADTADGIIKGLLSDMPVAAGNIITNGITALKNNSEAPLEIINAVISMLALVELAVSGTNIKKLSASGVSAIINGSFDIVYGDSIDADLDALKAESLSVNDIIVSGEKIVPVTVWNTWYDAHAENTSSEYFGTLPYYPLNTDALPINGFDNPLIDNPFYPDWINVGNKPGSGWKPGYAWVPSIEMPNAPFWLDDDNVYWHQVQITQDLFYASAGAFYPPRCASPSNPARYNEVPPFKKEADGLIVTIRLMDSSSLNISLVEQFNYINEKAWHWAPKNTVSLKGPRIAQFVAKRAFSITNNRITSVEYQLLPLEDLNGAGT